MNFIHVGFAIAGAAAMTLPIWIHLLLKQRARSVEIGSIRFLKDVIRRTRNRQRIQRWLLLAMRALAILLLGLLFARPFLPGTPSDGRTREVAVLIDRSASMSASHENGKTAMQEAVGRARKWIATLGDQARVHIGLFDASGVETIRLQELAQAKPAATRTSFDDALAWAADVLDASDRRDRSVLLLSDLQQSGLQTSAMPAFAADLDVRVEDTAPAVNQNLAISNVSPTQVELRPGVPIAIAIRMLNSGVFPVTDAPVRVQLRGPGGRLEQDLKVSLQAGEQKTIPIELPISQPGIFQGTVSIQREDPLAHDNQRYVAFEIRHPDRLLLVDGDPGNQPWESETYFLETALRLQTPIGDAPARTFEIERLIWDQGSGFPDLTGFRLIVLADLARFGPNDARRMKQFVQDGGHVLWFVGERNHSAVLANLLDSGLLGNTKLGEPTDTLARVTAWNDQHPALQPFQNPQHGDLRTLVVNRMIPVEKVDPDSTVLLRSNRSPLIVAHATGGGTFVLVNTTANRSWSQWPQNRLFVPLVRQLAAWLTGQLDARQPVIDELIGEPQQVPGIASLDNSLVVRNPDPIESDIRRLGVDQFRERIGLSQQAELDVDSEAIQQRTPAGAARADEQWPIVVWLLVGLLGLEFLLASRTHE
jgi:hypothetical protein